MYQRRTYSWSMMPMWLRVGLSKSVCPSTTTTRTRPTRACVLGRRRTSEWPPYVSFHRLGLVRCVLTCISSIYCCLSVALSMLGFSGKRRYSDWECSRCNHPFVSEQWFRRRERSVSRFASRRTMAFRLALQVRRERSPCACCITNFSADMYRAGSLCARFPRDIWGRGQQEAQYSPLRLASPGVLLSHLGLHRTQDAPYRPSSIA